MPIVCEEINGSMEGSSYGQVNKFVRTYPKPNPQTPLGVDWKFDPCFLPLKYKMYAEQFENFQVYPDDVFSVTCPKSGSTWSQEMIWLLNNDLNYEKAMEKDIFTRIPDMTVDVVFPSITLNILEIANEIPSPRLLKCHLPAGLLPKQIWSVKPKIIYTARSIKDTAISFYHHYVNFNQYSGSLEDFLNAFLDNRILFNPNHSHIRDFWYMRNEPNVLFLTYEEMKEDLFAVLKRTSTFLGKSYTNDELLNLEKHLSFDAMKRNASVNFEGTVKTLRAIHASNLQEDDQVVSDTEIRFIRKGIVGSHKEEMPPEFIERFDKITEEFNRLHGTNITP